MATSSTGPSAEREHIPTKEQLRDLEAIRPGIENWLRASIPGADDLEVTDVCLPTGAGVANETLLVSTIHTIGGERREAGYVVRVGAQEHLFLGMDVEMHYRLYQILDRHADIPSPPLIGFEPDRSLFGEPFFVMRRVEGRVPSDNPNFYEAGWVSELSSDERHEMWRNTVATMAKLHRLDPAQFLLLDRPELGGNGIEQELNHWLRYAKWCGGDQFPAVQRMTEWLQRNLPRNPTGGLSWGDARPPNIIYQGVRCAAVLDWDMVSLAGAECDLAWWTWMDQSHSVLRGVPRPSGFGTPRETVALWEEMAGRKAENLDWHLVLNALRIRLIMTRLPAMLQAGGLATPQQAARMSAEVKEMEWLAGLLEAPPAGPHESAWTGWDV